MLRLNHLEQCNWFSVSKLHGIFAAPVRCQRRGKSTYRDSENKIEAGQKRTKVE
jgi:hypothetical protein